MAKILIGPGRLSFPQLFERGSEEFGGKYGCTILLPPTYDLTPLKKALHDAAAEKWGPDPSQWPKMKHTPATVIKKAETKEMAGYEPGWHFITLSSKDQPGVVDASLHEVTDPRQVYPGRWIMVSANAFAWDNKFGKGVSFGLMNVQVRKHDDPFGGKGPAKNDFQEWAEEMPSDSTGSNQTPAAAGASGWGDDDN